jgi:hypothetical protein
LGSSSNRSVRSRSFCGFFSAFITNFGDFARNFTPQKHTDHPFSQRDHYHTVEEFRILALPLHHSSNDNVMSLKPDRSSDMTEVKPEPSV